LLYARLPAALPLPYDRELYARTPEPVSPAARSRANEALPAARLPESARPPDDGVPEARLE